MAQTTDDVEGLFKERQEEQLKLIQDSIDDIDSMIKERGELHNSMIASMDKLDLFIDNRMPAIEAMKGANTAAGDIIKELMKKKIEIEEIKLQEKLNYWRDVALLKKELREHKKEFRDLQSKTSMVDNLLGI